MLVHTSHMPIRWGDMDALGHVNNTVYFRYMEQARIEWFYAFARKIGSAPYAENGPVIVNASCTFLEPLVYPGEVEVTHVPRRAGPHERRLALRDLDGRRNLRRRRGEDRLDRPQDRANRSPLPRRHRGAAAQAT